MFLRCPSAFKIAFYFATLPAFTSAQESDIERLRMPFSPDEERPRVIIYPLIDQRCLASEKQEGTNALPPEDLSLWADFLKEFSKNSNLNISLPEATVQSIEQNKPNRRSLDAIQKLANRAYADYREVRLEEAIEGLRDAADGFYAIEHHIIAPREVARLTLTMGLAYLELGDQASAASAFREALSVDPCLRLRAGYDHPKAVELFERIRSELAHHPEEPLDFSTRSPSSSFLLRSRLLPDGHLSIVMQSTAGVSFDQASQKPGSASRLASRLATCLPFTYKRKSQQSKKHLYLDGGFADFVFTERPVEMFNNVGIVANASWLLDKHVGLDLRLGLFNSSRDREEDLRQDIQTFRLALGPSFQILFNKFRLFSVIGLELASMGKVITTDNAACKYFSQNDPIPSSICDHDVDIRRSEGSLHIGASLALGFALNIGSRLYTGLRAEAAWYSYETEENALGLPIGGQLFLGYRVF